jgi:hypothetical protein
MSYVVPVVDLLLSKNRGIFEWLNIFIVPKE